MKHLEHNQDFRLNEILFEHRNKAYGAYALRTESDRILTKALFIGVSLLATISVAPFVVNAFKSDVVITDQGYDDPRIIKVVETPEKDPPVQIKPKPAPEKVKTIDDRLPEPKKIVTNEKKVVTPEEKINAVSGTQTSDGKEITTPTYVPTSTTIGTGPVINTAPPKVPVVPVEDPNEIIGEGGLSKSANFEGGIDAFRNKVMNKFDVSAFEEEGVVSTKITFVVETDGTISNIKANGKDASFNAEAIRTIKAVKGKWIPGKNKKNESVRSYFSFPISMKFDN